MATAAFRFPFLSLTRPPTTNTNLAYSRSTTHLSYSRSTSPMYHSSSSSRTILECNRPVQCKCFASHEPDGDDESRNETLEMFRAFLGRIFENSSENELEACIEKLVRPVTVFMVKGKHEENLRMLRVVDPIAADRLENRSDEQVERLIARARKFLTEYLEKKEEAEKKEEEEGNGHGHEDE